MPAQGTSSELHRLRWRVQLMPAIGDVFGDLRSLRSAPPGWAGREDERRAVFLASLEQSEQLLRTADRLGYATRPLNLFYGLSQAGRALMAAWSPPSAGIHNGWKLQGHGIGFHKQDVPFADRALTGQPPRGKAAADLDRSLPSFIGLSRVLDSAPLAHPVKLIDLWAALPEAIGRPAPGDDSRLGPINIEPPTIAADDAQTKVAAIQAWTHNWPLEPLTEWARMEHPEFNTKLHMFLLANYPTLRPPATNAMSQPWPVGWLGRRFSVVLTWDLGQTLDYQEAVWLLNAQLAPYRDGRWAFPAFAGQALHPLMIWWAVLYSLSMFARYEPQRWVELLDVDSSPWATPLEHLLDAALAAVPEVITETLRYSPSPFLDDEGGGQ